MIMKKQKVMSQMKGQDKIPGKQLNEMEIGNLPEKKKIQNNDSEDGPESREKIGGKDWGDARNVYQRPRRTKEQTNRDEKCYARSLSPQN